MSAKKTKKSKKAGDIFLTLLLIIAIGVFCYAAYNLYNIYTEYKKGSDEYNQIVQMAVTQRDPDKEEKKEDDRADETEDKLKAPIDVDFASLKSVNEDVIGWIYVEALDGISYPMVQGKNNDEYLYSTYEKNYNIAGTIFMDYENKSDFTDCNTLIYGHNMKNGSMFGSLKEFTKSDEAYKKSPYFWILTPEKNYRYEIISAYTTSVNSDTYTLFKGPGDEFQDYLNTIKGYSELKVREAALDLNIKDKIVTLSTCTGNQATRFVVQGKRVDTLNVK